MMVLKSRYVVPVDGPPIENGAVAIEADRIVEVGKARDLAAHPTIDYGDAVIVPGFANAHTHLELSLLAGRVPPSPDLVGWLRRLLVAMASAPNTEEHLACATGAGLAQSVSSGVTTIGDVTRRPRWTRPVLRDRGVRAVSFGEVIAIGNRRDLLTQRLEAAASTEYQTVRMQVGISPHAPYTVEPEAMRVCAATAKQTGAPLGIHLAESADEDAFTRYGTGALADFLRATGLDDDAIPVSGCGPVELAGRAGALTDRTVIAHGNYVTDEDIHLIAASGASVAYCPRTHAVFSHPPHRFREMLAAGINVCIGTDSLASNPDLSVLNELRFLHRLYPDFPVEKLLAMGTLHGARALGFAEHVGSITTGKAADLVVVPLNGSDSTDRWESILESATAPLAVYVAGRLHDESTQVR